MAYLKLNTSTGNTGLVSVTLNHCNKPFVFLIDTGSNISHIDKSFLDIFPEKKEQLQPNDKNTISLSGQIESLGVLTNSFSASCFTFNIKALVTDLSNLKSAIYKASNVNIQGILGTDFLNTYRCHLDFKKQRLHLT